MVNIPKVVLENIAKVPLGEEPLHRKSGIQKFGSRQEGNWLRYPWYASIARTPVYGHKDECGIFDCVLKSVIVKREKEFIVEPMTAATLSGIKDRGEGFDSYYESVGLKNLVVIRPRVTSFMNELSYANFMVKETDLVDTDALAIYLAADKKTRASLPTKEGSTTLYMSAVDLDLCPHLFSGVIPAGISVLAFHKDNACVWVVDNGQMKVYLQLTTPVDIVLMSASDRNTLIHKNSWKGSKDFMVYEAMLEVKDIRYEGKI